MKKLYFRHLLILLACAYSTNGLANRTNFLTNEPPALASPVESKVELIFSSPTPQSSPVYQRRNLGAEAFSVILDGESCPSPETEILNPRFSGQISAIDEVLTCKSDSFLTSMSSSAIYSPKNCSDYTRCLRGAKHTTNPRADEQVRNFIARDFIKNRIETDVAFLEDEEAVRKLAQNILGEDYKKMTNDLAQSCLPNFKNLQKREDICNINLVEHVFESIQSSCGSGNGKACYNVDMSSEGGFQDYQSYKKKVRNPSSSNSFMLDYLDAKTSHTASKYEDKDQEYAKNLYAAFQSGEFKNLSAAQILAKFEANYQDSDLLLSYIDLKDSKSDEEALRLTPSRETGAVHRRLENEKKNRRNDKANILAALLKGNSANEAEFMSAFNKYRASEMKRTLGNGDPFQCRRQDKMLKICYEGMAIVKGESLPTTDSANENYFTLINELDENKLKELRRIGNFTEKDDLHTQFFLNKARCQALGNNGSGYSFRLANEARETEANRVSAEDEALISSGATSAGGSGFSSYSLDGGRRELTEFLGGSSSEENSDIKEVEASSGTEKGAIRKMIANEMDSMGSGEYYNPAESDYNFGAPTIISRNVASEIARKENERVKEEEEKNKHSEEKNNSDERITDLMKRLADAEKNVEKLKATKTESKKPSNEEDKAIRVENELIKELRNQIADLKEERKENSSVKAQKTTSGAATTKMVTPSPFISSTPVASSAAAAKAVTNEPANRKATQTTSASGAGSAQVAVAKRGASSSSSGITLTSSNTGGEVKTLASGGTLTRIDGLSKEKAQQAIVSRIKELKGSSFLIEEGGKIKEIVAEMENGKIKLDEFGNPIYKTIEVGLAKDKRFALKEEAGRKPASAPITDTADLKRDQEEQLKKERAEYEKLKGLTKQLIKQ